MGAESVPDVSRKAVSPNIRDRGEVRSKPSMPGGGAAEAAFLAPEPGVA